MKKLLLISAGLILLGAGCSSATNTSPTGANKPNSTPTASQPPAQTPQQQAAADTVKNNPPIQTPTTNQQADATLSYTLAEVGQNNSPSKCWTAVNGYVYDVTAYAPKHPGGKEQVYAICGKDGSTLFNGKHGMNDKAKAMMEKLKIGILK